MEGWVELGDRLHTEMVYPPTDGNPSKSNPAMHGKLATIWSRVRRPNHYFTKPTKYQNLSKIATIWVIGEDTAFQKPDCGDFYTVTDILYVTDWAAVSSVAEDEFVVV